MTSSYTNRKRLEKQGVGENNNAWGGYLNLNTIDLVDECFGVVCVAMTTGGDSTLSTQNGLSDEGRRSQIILTGTPTSNVRLFVPAVQSFYLVRNKMAGTRKVILTNAGGVNGVDFSGAGSGAEQGLVASDGTNVREIFRTSSVGALSVFTRGMILPFYNSVGAIPTGWNVCDGLNGTPNLNDRFILGTTSNTNIDTSGGAVALTATSNGDHAHGGTTGSTVLVSANIPAHSHFSFGNFFADYGTDPINDPGLRKAAQQGGAAGGFSYIMAGLVTSANVSHGQTSWAYSSTATGHTHTIATGGGHTHAITDGRPPFHRLLYIMKA